MSARRSRWVARMWAVVAVTAALVAVTLLAFGAWSTLSPSTAEREDDAARAHAVEVAEQFTATTSSTTVTVQTPSTIDTSTTTTTMIPASEVPPTWPAGGETVGLLTFEAAGIESLPIVMPEVGQSIHDTMDEGVAVPYETSAPISATAVVNSAFTAHRTTFGGSFRHLDDAAVGDPIVIVDATGIELHYRVVAVDLLLPTAVEIALPTNVHDGQATLRLITCSRPDGSPGGTSRRLVVTAVLDAAMSASPLTTVTG